MNQLKDRLMKKEKPLGIFVDTASSYIVECIGRTGFDFVIIDNEHSPVEAETSADLIRAAELSGLTPLVRVRENSRPAVLKVLDVGAQGLVVPNINSAEEVKELISYCKYKPIDAVTQFFTPLFPFLNCPVDGSLQVPLVLKKYLS